MSGRGEARPPLSSDPRMWQVLAGAGPALPPYVLDMPATPLSVFGQNIWEYPVEWLAVNNRDRRFLDFEAPATFSDGAKIGLDPRRDEVLIRQLKEATWASLHRRHVFDGRRRSQLIKPGGAHGVLRRLRRLMLAFRQVGCASLSNVTPTTLVDAFGLLGSSGGEFDEMVGAFQDLVTLSRAGLIDGGILDHRFEIVPPDTAVPDASAARGWQPIPDDKVAELIRASNLYIDLADEIAVQIRILREDPSRHEDVYAWARERLPCGTRLGSQGLLMTLTLVVHVSAANLVSFLGGLRVSELLSILTGFVAISNGETTIDLGRLTMEFTTTKTVLSFRGERRQIIAHPRIADIGRALLLLKESLDTTGDYLFVPPGEDLPYVTNRFNYVLQRFCRLHAIDIEMSSHRWRKTVAAISVRVLTGATLHLKELFGHVGLGMTARYILSSPFIREEIRDLTLDEYRKRGRTMLESLSAFGGPGLGGRRGLDMEASFSALMRSQVTEDDLGLQLDGFVEDMLRQGIFVVPVMPGVLCTKPATASGACSRSSGDSLADPARCSARCSYQVQESNRRDLVAWMVRRAASNRGMWSPLEEVYWAEQCRDQIVAWPVLNDALRDVIEDWPALKTASSGVEHA